MSPKKKAVLDRIKNLEEAIAKGGEYLESGKHAHWSGFRPYVCPQDERWQGSAASQRMGEKCFSSTCGKGIEASRENA
jgi:hypothetical protein